ncbi:MAG: efflux transporter periplasmic adaptor subunit, partial [Hylemonella sp.]|nr:efflux transporter periplasmic adaptor subunit [Hylemonella sp.]
GQVRHATVTLGRRGTAEGTEMVLVEGLAEGSQVLAGSVGPLREGTVVLRSKSQPSNVQGR